MALTTFLRRYNTQTRNLEYLFIPDDGKQLIWQNDSVTPALPTNSSANVSGSNSNTPDNNKSPNFEIDLGIAQRTIRVTGTLQSVTSNQIPQFTNPQGAGPPQEVYIAPVGLNDSLGTPPSTISNPVTLPDQTHLSTTPIAYSGTDLREVIDAYVSDQAISGVVKNDRGDGSSGTVIYSNFTLGYYNWGGSTDVVPNGWLDNDPPIGQTAGSALVGTYRLWNGLVKNLQFTEVAGEPNIFDYQFDFVVGQVVAP
jgi:hypothetical protein